MIMRNSDSQILLSHGSGGKLSHALVEEMIVPILSGNEAGPLNDSAIVGIGNRKIAFTTDSYIIDPIFFPGGDIGKLSVCGTVNDLAMSGAVPQFLSLGLLIEEGFPLSDLRRILESIRRTADEARVKIVTGDTKIVTKGGADKIFINTAGIGYLPENIAVGAEKASPGDKILLSGTMGDHGIAILSKREGLRFETTIESDVAPLNSLTASLFEHGIEVHVLRDPTRGGVAGSLVEIAKSSGFAVRIYEENLPVTKGVAAACEILGMEPLYIANEGKCIAVVKAADADRALDLLRIHPLGKDAAIIGEVTENPAGRVLLHTRLGTARIIELLTGEQLPRIC